jgi:hypothetical protein
MFKFSCIVIFIFCTQVSIFAQDTTRHSPPIPVEFMVGNNRLFFQMSISKPILPNSKLGFFNITSFQTDYKESKKEPDFVSISWLYYNVYKGIAPLAGVAMNYVNGISTFAGVQYVFANRKVLFVAAPSVFLTESKNLEIFTKFEFKPDINPKIKLYTNLQGLLNRNTKENHHARSYFYSRIGLTQKGISYGLGANFDSYSPLKIRKNNFGVFVKADLF